MALWPRPWWRELQGSPAAAKTPRARRTGLAVVATIVALGVGALSQTPGSRLLEARAFDYLSTIAPPAPPPEMPLIVAIDEPSFAELGQQWPWPRDTHARLVTALREAGARAIALDIVFAEGSQPGADAALAAALGPDTVMAADERVIERPHAVLRMRTEPLLILLESGAISGLSTIPLDRDGVARRLPERPDILSRALLERNGGSAPATPAGALLQFYGQARSAPTVSYYQALDPQTLLPAGWFQGRDVIVGLSLQAAPTVEEGGADAFPTPATVRSGALMSGVEIHATAAANLAARHWIVPASLPAQVASLLVASALAAMLLLQAGRGRRLVPLALGLGMLPLGCWLALRFGRLWLPPLAPMAAFLGTAATQTLSDFAAERRLRAGLTRAFSHYLAPALVERLAADPGALRLGGESRVVTVLFCDIRGFTALTERLGDDPERLTTILRRLMEPLSQAVLDEQGTIDKYIGDCLMAFWNAPLDVPDHALRAIAAGRRMIAALAALNSEFAREGIAPLAVGIGINTGTCIVGNMGSGARFDYSVLGDAVNLASRLEELTKSIGVPLIAGEATAAAVGPDGGLRPIGQATVRGRAAPTRLFTLREV